MLFSSIFFSGFFSFLEFRVFFSNNFLIFDGRSDLERYFVSFGSMSVPIFLLANFIFETEVLFIELMFSFSKSDKSSNLSNQEV